MQTTRTIAWVLFGLLFGCGAKTIHLDETTGQGDATAPPGGGSGGSNIDRGVPNASVVVDHQDLVLEIIVDATRLYWYTGTTDLLGSSLVRSCSKADCASSIVTYDTRPNDANGEFVSLAVDATNVYWVRSGEELGQNSASVFACPIDGCTGSPRLTRRIVARSSQDPALSSVVSDGEQLYWAAPAETGIFRCAVTSCADAAETVVLNQETLGALAVDATHVYWIANSGKANSAILRAPKDGSTLPETIASAQNHALSLALDKEFVYWTNHHVIGTISRCPLAGCSGPPTVLVSNQDYPAGLATDGHKLFWINSGGSQDDSVSMTLLKCLADACQSTFEVLGHPLIYSWLEQPPVALDDSYVYWIFHGTRAESGGFPLAAIERVAK